MTIERVHYVGGFARARWFTARDFLSETASADAIAAAEIELLAELNKDEVRALVMERLRRGEGWSMIALDPEGCDLRRGNTLARLEFPRPAHDPEQARAMLVEMSAELKGEQHNA